MGISIDGFRPVYVHVHTKLQSYPGSMLQLRERLSRLSQRERLLEITNHIFLSPQMLRCRPLGGSYFS